MTEIAHARTAEQAEFRLGMMAGLSAYLLWGFLPIYYTLTDEVSALIVVAYRVIWSVGFVALYLALVGRMGEVRAILGDRKLLSRLFVSACVISLNWLTFIWAIDVGRVLEVSFGYFINPLVSIVIGMVLLGERLNRTQAVAVCLTVVAIGIQAVSIGALPWVSLVLAFTFATYGYLRKTIPVGATPGLLTEALVVSPFFLALLLYLGGSGENVLPLEAPGLMAALIGTGAVTALPLILFATGARRLPLSVMGFMQYVAPSIHFILAISLWNEPLSQAKLASFVMIWISLAIFSVDMLRRGRGR
ncbi:EamA family transporter RarD [Stappia sp. GBMRC 2046]|uniref:EamA family transporter RarD n=1 Tax=Stappia sediminis TaxID=2692190 RepID=A0A7X3S9P0_9HYPH|nr:EamA family transporter RarD [Stappia sediminis]MXN67093.1 EamA family transporter RarD [Stappia sediminis]